jgi:hypothetical protein
MKTFMIAARIETVVRCHARKGGGPPYLTGCAVGLGCSTGVPRPGE